MRWLALCLFAFLSVATSVAQRYGTTYSSLDDQTTIDGGAGKPGWGSCTGSACAGGVNSATAYSTSPVGWPSLDGQSRQFYIYAQSPYSDALWYYKLGLSSSATRFKFELRFYIDQNAASNAQAFEFDTFQNYNNQRYTFGMQCDLASDTWDVWNGATGSWVPTQIACNGFSPNRWHHLTLRYHRTSDLNMHYDSLTLDGVSMNVGYTEPSYSLPAGWANNLGAQFQLDTGANGGQMTMWVDEVSLTTWQ